MFGVGLFGPFGLLFVRCFLVTGRYVCSYLFSGGFQGLVCGLLGFAFDFGYLMHWLCLFCF